MEDHKIELVTDESVACEQQDVVVACSPGWCGPVDGFMLDIQDSNDA